MELFHTVQQIYKPKNCSVVQKPVSHILAVNETITLYKIGFDGLLNIILLKHQLMTFSMTLMT